MLISSSVILLIGAIYYGMNVVFWSRFFIGQSVNTMMTTYRTLKGLVADEETFTEDLEYAVLSARNSTGISFGLQGEADWDFRMMTQRMLSPMEREFLRERLQACLLQGSQENVEILQKGEEYTLQRLTVKEEEQYLECYGYMRDASGNEKKFILSMPLANIFTVSAISNSYYLVLTLIVMFLGCILIYFVTRSVTAPILQLSDISKKMSRLDFSARYRGHDRNEIGLLGDNMNEMASQLERTILQLRMANESLRRENEEKSHVDEMRRDFISNVSHELKTPIALIQGYAEGLREFSDDPESAAYYVDVIIDEADKMNRMVQKLLTLNQLEFGQDGLDEAPFDIMEMIRDQVRNSEKMRKEHDAEVTVEGPESCIVSGDAFKIEEVLNNYYSNALNHLAPPNRISFVYDDLGPNVRISVHNTGENIPEEDLSRIWIKFYKVDKARTRAYGGSGIGLSIVKAIMDAHGMECGVYNTEDGVTFWFELPKAMEQLELEMAAFEEAERADAPDDEEPGGTVPGEIIGDA